MDNQTYDIIVVGGGPAGLGAAVEARKFGAEKVLVIERDREPGGILNQCIHNGFGLHEFKEELTGPEYAQRFIEQAQEQGVEVLLNTMVIDITRDHKVVAVGENGLIHLQAKAIVLSMGCRERTAGAIAVSGYRPAGVYTAGMAQRIMNMEGYLVGKEVVIYGSGDIGLIMARRMTLEGAKVKAVVEIMPYSSGLARNIAQCLEDFDIPLLLSHQVRRIHGKERITGVTLVQVDENRNPVPGTEQDITCDTLLLSVGLIPENELSQNAEISLDRITSGPVVDNDMQTDADGIFACGNVVHVHDIVDFVTKESRIAGQHAALYAQGKLETGSSFATVADQGIGYVLPQKVYNRTEGNINLFMRPKKVYKNARLVVTQEGEILQSKVHRIMVPSEMIQVSLPYSALTHPGQALHFHVEESEQA